MKQVTYRMERCPNKDVVVLATRERFPRFFLSEYSLSDEAPQALNEIKQSHGVVGYCIGVSNPFEIQVTKGKMFTWDEVLPEFLDKLGKYFDMEFVPESNPQPSVLFVENDSDV